MSRYLFMLLVFVPHTAVAQATKPITNADSVFCIHTEDWGLDSSGGANLIVGIWSDGVVVWSGNRVEGGAPYFSAKIDPHAVSTAFKRITNRGVFDIPNLGRANWGPDSQFTAITFRDGDKQLRMESWHEIYEANGQTIAAESGLASLDDQKLLTALAEEPSKYLHYRMAWLELRLAAEQLIPKSGKETTGSAVMREGKLFWRFPND